jgi:hypothetical protein
MKLKRILPLALILVLATACLINPATTAPGAQGNLLPQPLAGLDKLTHYTASLTVSTQTKTAGASVDRTEQYSLSAWPTQSAAFEQINSFDDANQPMKMTIGKVGQADYLLWNGDTGCRASLDSQAIQVDATNLSPFLYALKSGTPAPDETVGGLPTHAYTLDSASIGIKGLQASGEVWLAASGGFLVKYHLVLTGGQALFGPDGQGTRTLDYALTGVNDGSPVAYPGDCLPISTDIPAMPDAQAIQRLPQDLQFTSASTLDQLQAFYKDYFTSHGWASVTNYRLPSGELDILYSQASTGHTATLALQPQGTLTAVEILDFSGQAAQSSTSAVQTPASSQPTSTNQNPLVVITTSLSKVLGNPKTPGVFSSCSLNMTENMPSASGTDSTTLQADLQGANYHYSMTSNGAKTEAIHLNGSDYSVVNGKTQPGSVMDTLNWSMWPLDAVVIISAATGASPTAQPGDTWEGRPVDIYSVDSTTSGAPLPDTSMGLLPFSVTSIKGTFWIDHATGGLIKADLQFEADVKNAGQATPIAHGQGLLQITVSHIGQATVSLP